MASGLAAGTAPPAAKRSSGSPPAKASELYLAGAFAPSLGYNEIFRPVGSYQHTLKRKTGEFRHITLLGGGAEFSDTTPPTVAGHNTVRQIAARGDGTIEEELFALSGLATITAGWRWGDLWVVGGNSATSSEGVLYGFLDADGDGRVEPASERELLRATAFHGGFSLTWNPQTQGLMLFHRPSNRLYELTGSDGDGFPTGFADLGQISTTRKDLFHVRLSANASWATAYPDLGIGLTKQTFATEARWSIDTGKFTYYRDFYPHAESQLTPGLMETPLPGDTLLKASGTPGKTYNAYRWESTTPILLGMAQTDPDGNALLPLDTPLSAGQQISIGRMGVDWSPWHTVPDYVAPWFFQPRLTGERVQFQAFGEPRRPYEFRYTDTLDGDLENWSVFPMTRASSSSGDAFYSRMLMPNAAQFVTGAAFDFPLEGTQNHCAIPVRGGQQ